MFAGKTMLSNGAETYRVEDTMNRICNSKENIKEVDSFVTQTGIFLTLQYDNEIFTYLKRVKNLDVNLDIVNKVNNFSRDYVNKNTSLLEANNKLEQINNSPGYPRFLKLLGGSYVSGFFSLMFGGTYLDFFASFISSFIAIFILDLLSNFQLTFL